MEIWFVLRTYGLSGLRAHIGNGIQMGIEFAEMLRSRLDLYEITIQPAYGLTMFCLLNTSKPSTIDSETLTRNVFTTIHEQAEFLSSTVDGVYTIRVVNANRPSQVGHVRKVF